jgi:hypothetical protein
MATATEVAQWMFEQVKTEGHLYRPNAVAYIEEHFGAEHLYYTNSGSIGIREEVRKEFRKLHGGTVEYYPGGDDYWRLKDS